MTGIIEINGFQYLAFLEVLVADPGLWAIGAYQNWGRILKIHYDTAGSQERYSGESNTTGDPFQM